VTATRRLLSADLARVIALTFVSRAQRSTK
jgi:hypothetical protein